MSSESSQENKRLNEDSEDEKDISFEEQIKHKYKLHMKRQQTVLLEGRNQSLQEMMKDNPVVIFPSKYV